MTPEPKKTQAPAQTPQQVTITLPPGVTAEQYQKSYKAWEDAKVKSALIMKADWKAMTTTCKAHPEEYHQNRVKEWKALGLDPSKLKVKK